MRMNVSEFRRSRLDQIKALLDKAEHYCKNNPYNPEELMTQEDQDEFWRLSKELNHSYEKKTPEQPVYSAVMMNHTPEQEAELKDAYGVLVKSINEMKK